MRSGTLFFLGYFRFEPSAPSDPACASTAVGPSAIPAHNIDSNNNNDGGAVTDTWLYKCQHNQHEYLCFPPYCSPGGLRSRIFPSEELSLGVAESNNPFDLLTNTPYLPAFIKEAIEVRQHDWNELGGSRCSFERYQFHNLVEKETQISNTSSSSSSSAPEGNHSQLNFVSRKGKEFLLVAQRSVAQSASRLSGLTAILAPEQTIHVQSQQRPFQKVPFALPSDQIICSEITMTNRQRTPSPAVHVATAITPTSNKLPNSAGKPIPQAVLVYHESAYSIVFRDHLRRQQKAIRQTSTLMEQSSHGDGIGSGGGNESAGYGSAGAHAYRRHTDGSRRTATATSRGAPYTITEESDMGYESTGSRGSTHSGGGESSSSVTSFRGGSSNPSQNNTYNINSITNQKKMPISELQPVVVANFQPVIQPLEPLELHSSNVFEPLLNANPSSLDLTEAECEVVELLRKEQAVVKTIRNADWTAFLQKFIPEEEGGWGKHEYHPSHRTHDGESGGDIDDAMKYPYNSFVTSTSLLPSCGKKMSTLRL